MSIHSPMLSRSAMPRPRVYFTNLLARSLVVHVAASLSGLTKPEPRSICIPGMGSPFNRRTGR
jgi:hypothetical protein